jgi:hypothetical protein
MFYHYLRAAFRPPAPASNEVAISSKQTADRTQTLYLLLVRGYTRDEYRISNEDPLIVA